MNRCPYCAEKIQKDAKICRFCGKDLSQSTLEPIDTRVGITENSNDWKKNISNNWGRIIISLIITIPFFLIIFYIFFPHRTSNSMLQIESTSLSKKNSNKQVLSESNQSATTSAINQQKTATAEFKYITIIDPFPAKLELLYGPESGFLRGDKDDKFIPSTSTYVNLQNFVVEATFRNPDDLPDGFWSYGFIFRQVKNEFQYRLVFDSSRRWRLIINSGSGESKPLIEEQADLQVGKGDTNKIRLVVKEDEGFLYINDAFVQRLDLSIQKKPGDIEIIAQNYSNEADIYTINYTKFSVWGVLNP